MNLVWDRDGSRTLAGAWVLAGLWLMAAATPPPIWSQTDSAPSSSIPGPVIRVIDDAATGDRWLLVLDAIDPGGPGRMVRVPNGGVVQSGREAAAGAGRASARIVAEGAAKPVPGVETRPVIRAGDAVIVVEQTAVVEARLEATALEPAVAGAVFCARLKIGGRVVRVVALAAGKAELGPEPKALP